MSLPMSHSTRSRASRALILGLLLVIASCSVDASPTLTPRPTFTTTSTTIPPTTTTVPLLAIDGAPEDLVEEIRRFYAAAGDPSAPAPVMPEIVLTALHDATPVTVTSGTASTGQFKGEGVAVVEVGADSFLVVNRGEQWEIVGGDWPSLEIPPYFGPSPRLVTIVGSDARPGQAIAATRADSIHFVGLDGAGGGGIVGLPRDSFVPVPGYGRRKITESLALGGPDVMQQAFTDLTGLPLEGYVITGFAGFQALLDGILGAVPVTVPFAISDKAAKANLSPGEQLLNGAQALSFARARKTVPGGDFARSKHQGVIMLGALSVLQAQGFRALPQFMELAEPHLVTSLSAEQILTFAAMAIRSDLSAIPNIVAPGRPGSAGAASVVFLSEAAAGVWADLADGNLSG